MRLFSTLKEFLIGWTLAMGIWFVLRSADIESILGQEVNLVENLFAFILLSVLGGIYFGIIEHLIETRFYGRMPLWRLIITIFIYHSAGVLFLVVFVYFLFTAFFTIQPSLTISTVLKSESALAFYGYAMFINFAVVFYKQMAYMIGRFKLSKIIRGYYYTPKEENRVFLFIDLKDSTKIAENLSHIMYSKFIQDCFYDLKVVERYGAELYQYVGDEAVLTWHISKHFKFTICVDAFWAFRRQLDSREEYYLNTYGHKPVFKAGVHSGLVTTAEIGHRYRDIAYHGDTINTAARVQQASKNSDGLFLASMSFSEKIDPSHYQIASLGAIDLKGKKQPLEIVTISPK